MVKNYEKIFVKILWGDADLGEFSSRFSIVRNLSAGRSVFADIKTTIWPLREDLVILEREAGRVFLNSAIPWHGIITTGDTVEILDPRKKGRRNYEIKTNSFATLRYEDVTVAIRVGREHPERQAVGHNKSMFQGKILGLFADTRYEQIAMCISIVAASVLTGAVFFGLGQRDVWRSQNARDVSDEARLPFISPGHFATAPSVLQDKLDRFRYVDSVSTYYSDLAEVLTNESPKSSGAMLFDSVKSKYKEALGEQHRQIEQLTEAVNNQSADLLKRGGRVIAVAAARGESLDGSIQRVLDKSALIVSSAQELVDTRALVAEAFSEDAAYDFSGKNTTSAKDPLAEFTKRLGEGYRAELSDDKQQVQEAKNLTIRSSSIQIDLFGKEHLLSGVIDCCGPLVGIKAGSTPISFVPRPRLEESDEKIASMKASVWGNIIPDQAKPKIVEPLLGVIDERAVEKSIDRGRFQLQLCFELALRRNQTAKGTMEWTWQIDTKGNLSRLALVKSTMKDQEFIQCVRQRIASWKFPRPKGGSVEIRYPFEFVKDKG